MSHDNVNDDDLLLLVCGELHAGRRADVEEKLKADPVLAAEAQQLREALAAVTPAEAVTPSSDFNASLRARLLAERASERLAVTKAKFRMRPFPKLAAAAAAAIVVALVGWLLIRAPDLTPRAYAEVMQAVENSQKAEWVHGKGRMAGKEFEVWFSLRPLRGFTRHGEHVQGEDYSAHRRYEYDPAERTLNITYLPEAPGQLHESKNFLDLLMQQLEEGRKKGLVVEIREESQTKAGKTYAVYVITIPEHGAEARITVDSAAHRIVEMATRTAEGPKAPGNYVLQIDYPETGPSGIYAVGVPRDAKVVEKLPSVDLLALHEKVEQARKRFAPSYRALIWKGWVPPGSDQYQLSQLVVVYKKNGRFRVEWGREPVALALPGPGLEELLRLLPPDDTAALEKWVQQVPPREVYFNENSMESKGVRVSRGPGGELRRDTTVGLPGETTVENLTWSWPIHTRTATMFPGKQAQFGPLLCTGYETQGRVYKGELGVFPSRIRRWWNPQRDYAREEFEQIEDVNAPWQEDKDWLQGAAPELIKRPWQLNEQEIRDYRATRTHRIVEYDRTPDGQWYARRIATESATNLQTSSPHMVVVHVDTESDIPEELLDPDSITPETLARQGVWELEFEKAMAIVDSREDWPATPRKLAEAYWKARNAKDFHEMGVLWPGSASWNRQICEKEKPVEYVLSKAQDDPVSGDVLVPYAAKGYYEKHGTYNLKMRLTNEKSSRGRYYIVSGN